MVLSERQKDLIRRQKSSEEELNEPDFVKPITRVRVGDTIEFINEPEFTGTVYKISRDQWKMIYIDYGVDGHCKILSPSELNKMIRSGDLRIIPKTKRRVTDK